MDEIIHPFLDAFRVQAQAPEFVPGRARRDWMDKFADRHPYRCLPLTMANSTGWELLCPFTVDVEWDGGAMEDAINITSPEPDVHIAGFAQSHFRKGIVTFHTGHLFRTPPGWAVWCTGAPNWPKDGVYPLTGLVETDWLPFPFTMNWQLTRPGKVRFEKGEPFCFLSLMEHRRLDAVEPKIKTLESDPALKMDYQNWNTSRADFITRLSALEDKAVSEGWQRHYMRGQSASGDEMASDHDTKRRLKKPKDLTGEAVLTPK